MSPPVRLVCGACLRSVELAPSEEPATDGLCPFCGQVIDSEADRTELRTKIANHPGSEAGWPAQSRGAESSSDWAGMWSRGSHGSLGRFQLRERLGDGGFGEVFLAFDPRLDRDVAIKVLKQSNPTERVMERFFREARAAARLDHPNIVAVHDAGFDNGRCWVSFHFVSGRPLNWYRDHHRLDPPTAARIMRDLANAVDHAHHQGVIHRDIKPGNVLIDDHGRPRLIDFGLSRRSDVESSLTHDGAVVGTPAYMSPEQALGFSRKVDERSDVFSLGVMFFEVLSGQRPYPSSSHGGLSDPENVPPKVARKTIPPSARALNPVVPSALDRICMRAIAQTPRDRYPSARALADDLDDWLVRHRGGKTRLSFTIGALVLGLAAALLAIIAGGAALLAWNQQIRPGGVTKVLSVVLPFLSPDASPPAVPDLKAAPPSDPPSPPSSPPPASGGNMKPSTPKGQFVGSTHSGKFHLPTCSTARQITEGNWVDIRDAEEAAANNLKPCGICRPLIAGTRSR